MYFVDAHLNQFTEAILISTHKIGFMKKCGKLSLNHHEIHILSVLLETYEENKHKSLFIV